jgi:hypothetical protein
LHGFRNWILEDLLAFAIFEAVHHEPVAHPVTHENLECGSMAWLKRQDLTPCGLPMFDAVCLGRKQAGALQRGVLFCEQDAV